MAAAAAGAGAGRYCEPSLAEDLDDGVNAAAFQRRVLRKDASITQDFEAVCKRFVKHFSEAPEGKVAAINNAEWHVDVYCGFPDLRLRLLGDEPHSDRHTPTPFWGWLWLVQTTSVYVLTQTTCLELFKILLRTGCRAQQLTQKDRAGHTPLAFLAQYCPHRPYAFTMLVDQLQLLQEQQQHVLPHATSDDQKQRSPSVLKDFGLEPNDKLELLCALAKSNPVLLPMVSQRPELMRMLFARPAEYDKAQKTPLCRVVNDDNGVWMARHLPPFLLNLCFRNDDTDPLPPLMYCIHTVRLPQTLAGLLDRAPFDVFLQREVYLTKQSVKRVRAVDLLYELDVDDGVHVVERTDESPIDLTASDGDDRKPSEFARIHPVEASCLRALCDPSYFTHVVDLLHERLGRIIVKPLLPMIVVYLLGHRHAAAVIADAMAAAPLPNAAVSDTMPAITPPAVPAAAQVPAAAAAVAPAAAAGTVRRLVSTEAEPAAKRQRR